MHHIEAPLGHSAWRTVGVEVIRVSRYIEFAPVACDEPVFSPIKTAWEMVGKLPEEVGERFREQLASLLVKRGWGEGVDVKIKEF